MNVSVPLIFVAAVATGLIGAKVWDWRDAPVTDGAATAIQWNAVQAVPTRKPDADDIAWEKRSREIDAASTDDRDNAPQAFSQCDFGRAANCVVDGDTFYLNGQKVRIVGIDAPETHPPHCDYEARLGDAATRKLISLLNSGSVTTAPIERERDVYGRLLRNVDVNGVNVGEAMISAGVARPYGNGRRPWC